MTRSCAVSCSVTVRENYASLLDLLGRAEEATALRAQAETIRRWHEAQTSGSVLI